MRLAESYFEAGDYGNAILAAQEVLQRDAGDQFSTGILAVSGLRVANDALSTLRAQNSSMARDTRSEAENLTEKLRELLRQPRLVPQPRTPSPPARMRPAPSPPAPQSMAPERAKPAVPAPATPGTARPSTGPTDDPFRALK